MLGYQVLEKHNIMPYNNRGQDKRNRVCVHVRVGELVEIVKVR